MSRAAFFAAGFVGTFTAAVNFLTCMNPDVCVSSAVAEYRSFVGAVLLQMNGLCYSRDYVEYSSVASNLSLQLHGNCNLQTQRGKGAGAGDPHYEIGNLGPNIVCLLRCIRNQDKHIWTLRYSHVLASRVFDSGFGMQFCIGKVYSQMVSHLCEWECDLWALCLCSISLGTKSSRSGMWRALRWMFNEDLRAARYLLPWNYCMEMTFSARVPHHVKCFPLRTIHIHTRILSSTWRFKLEEYKIMFT